MSTKGRVCGLKVLKLFILLTVGNMKFLFQFRFEDISFMTLSRTIGFSKELVPKSAFSCSNQITSTSVL
jgi:hypothetical protein